MDSLIRRLRRLERRLLPVKPPMQLLGYPTQQAYELAKANGEIVGPSRIYIGVDVEMV
jgi:hypothetical protein